LPSPCSYSPLICNVGGPAARAPLQRAAWPGRRRREARPRSSARRAHYELAEASRQELAVASRARAAKRTRIMAAARRWPTAMDFRARCRAALTERFSPGCTGPQVRAAPALALTAPHERAVPLASALGAVRAPSCWTSRGWVPRRAMAPWTCIRIARLHRGAPRTRSNPRHHAQGPLHVRRHSRNTSHAPRALSASKAGLSTLKLAASEYLALRFPCVPVVRLTLYHRYRRLLSAVRDAQFS